MKNVSLIKMFFVVLISCFLLSSCNEKGSTTMSLNGTETNLPSELKGLKVYTVATSRAGYIKVAVLNGEVNSTTYSKGKTKNQQLLLIKRPVKYIRLEKF